jgi:hypothetical protein
MSDDKVPVPAQDVQTLKARKPLFDLGLCVATPAVLAHLERHSIFPAALLSRHQHGDWGNVDAEDAEANGQAAVQSGARVISSYTVAGAVIWVITEAVGDDGKRASSCLLFPEEY